MLHSHDVIVKIHTLQQLKAYFSKQCTGLLNLVVQICNSFAFALNALCAFATCTNNTLESI